jgi:hypothetical protein
VGDRVWRPDLLATPSVERLISGILHAVAFQFLIIGIAD